MYSPHYTETIHLYTFVTNMAAARQASVSYWMKGLLSNTQESQFKPNSILWKS